MLTAVAHIPSPALNQCELTFLSPQPIVFENARRQHNSYCDMLRRCGVDVIILAKNVSLPDSVFVEDTALVLDEMAIVTSMGVVSRQQETELINTELARFRTIEQLLPPARLEGGDVLRIGKRLYVGLSSRTNREGVQALEQLVKRYDYQVIPVNVTGCLHLKTGCTALDDQTVLINPTWVDSKPFESFKRLVVPNEEPFAANILRIGNTVCLHSGFIRTRQMIEQLRYNLELTDISEFLKAEAGLTCMSLIFKAQSTTVDSTSGAQ